MSEVEFKKLSELAYAYLEEQQELSMEKYQLASYERYDWDQEKRELVWSNGGVPKVIADIQFVGSLSTISNTWLWSWANPSVLDQLSQAVLDVQAYGQEHGIKKLIEEKWPADEIDGWEMTAITAYLLKARGAYRSPDEDGFTYLIYTEIRFAPGQEPGGEQNEEEHNGAP